MTLRLYLILMSVATLICWVISGFLVMTVDPAGAGALILTFFYASIFLSFVGTFSLLGFLIKWRILKDDDVVFRHVKKTFRQSILFSAFIILALWLLHRGWIRWWNAIILMLLLIFLEGVIFANRKYNNREYV